MLELVGAVLLMYLVVGVAGKWGSRKWSVLGGTRDSGPRTSVDSSAEQRSDT